MQNLFEPNAHFSFIVRLVISIICSGHHDTYRFDIIVELAADVGISPSFPIPENLSICIATMESFGNIPGPENIAEELGFERREEPAYEVNDKGNLLH